MKLLRLKALSYGSLREETIELSDLNLFIGANASGKSTILDALRFLHEGVQARDFRAPVFSRGGILNLAWKGEVAQQVELVVRVEDGGKIYEWSVRLTRDGWSPALAAINGRKPITEVRSNGAAGEKDFFMGDVRWREGDLLAKHSVPSAPSYSIGDSQ